jgi:hypothetical protein
MATNLHLVMRKHLKLKKALAEFRAKPTDFFTSNDVKTIIQLDKDITEVEGMMDVFIPKNFLSEQLKELQK